MKLSPEIVYQAKLELARRDFWDYCKLTAPDFYKESRPFLKDMCYQLQSFYESDEKILVINLPPRHGKSRTATQFVKWLFGQSIHNKVMTGSYNETLSMTFAKQVRDAILEEKTDGILSYSDIFPDTKVKRGESSANKWALEGSQQTNYLATSPNGTATGFGCNIMIIDDLIKSSEEAFNENTLNKHINWFTDTMLSRTESGFKLIIIMTRWAKKDLAGYILDNYSCRHINYKALQEDGSMLCDEILNKDDFLFKTKSMSKEIVEANYQQEPIDIKGRLYTQFKTYTELPKNYKYILNYTDTADTGEDYLCSIDYLVVGEDYYIIDIVCTKEAMEITEPMVAKMITKDKVGCAIIESNNGGRSFARNVKTECQKLKNNHTNIQWFHQSENKQARIFSNSASVMAHVFYPHNWIDKYPEFADMMIRYQKEGKNAHDDCPDAVTGVYEHNQPLGQWLY